MIESSPYRGPVTVETLKRICLFDGFDDSTLEFLVSTLKTRITEPGEYVFREGERSGSVYVVLDGELEVLKRSRGGVETRLALLSVNDWFGEMSIIDSQPNSASLRALADSRLLVLSEADREALAKVDNSVHPKLVFNIAKELCRRLRVADGVLADMIDPPESWPKRFLRN